MIKRLYYCSAKKEIPIEKPLIFSLKILKLDQISEVFSERVTRHKGNALLRLLSLLEVCNLKNHHYYSEAGERQIV